jgi:hypothetical protein
MFIVVVIETGIVLIALLATSEIESGTAGNVADYSSAP